MTQQPALEFIQFSHPREMTPARQQELVDCWAEVSNAGGAVGFPFLPVSHDEVAAAADALIAGLGPQRSRLLLASAGGELAGWLNIRRDPHPLVAHWGTLHHVQTGLAFRGTGTGAALMRQARDMAREDMGLEQLRLAVRAGMGLEDFYGHLGWKEIGRWTGALRLAPGDDRDEILMALTL
ncbi:GNAT family N-acetyltransferase [Streptomyces sp. NBC_01104]|uniref:GNAT family N-acetyltransferase n=1 Tax=Streptomyces sp. NBC_01104 TaxID=2903750 RepID=UPI00386459DA|nr:GNAT family N-acetyltransferase [Streptomyces sp. NBC_01104]